MAGDWITVRRGGPSRVVIILRLSDALIRDWTNQGAKVCDRMASESKESIERI